MLFRRTVFEFICFGFYPNNHLKNKRSVSLCNSLQQENSELVDKPQTLIQYHSKKKNGDGVVNNNIEKNIS